MANEKNQTQTQTQTQSDTIEVLYQKMGDRWFAFSLIDDEVFVGSISQSEIDGSSTGAPTPGSRVMKVHRNVGHS